MQSCYFLKILLKTRSMNKHESNLATGKKFLAGKCWNYFSCSKGVSPFCGSRKYLSQSCCRIVGRDGKVKRGHKDLLRMKNLHSGICVKNLQTQGRTTKGHSFASLKLAEEVVFLSDTGVDISLYPSTTIKLL